MRVTNLFLAAAFACALAPAEARAEADKVKTNQSAKVFARRGEQAKVIVQVGKGTPMKRLKVQGRWVQVRVKGRTGWVPRSVLDMPDEEITRNTRRRPFVDGRGTKRGFGGEEGPGDRIGADAIGEGGSDEPQDEEDEEDEAPRKPSKTVATKATPKASDDEEDEEDEDDDEAEVEDEDEDEDPSGEGDPEDEEDTGPPRKQVRVAGKTPLYVDPDEDSEVEVYANEDMALYPTGNREGKYVEVENDEGDLGWVMEDEIESVAEIGEDGEVIGGSRTRHIDAKARLGVTILQQGMRTAGGSDGIPNNYNLSTSAATIALGGTVLFPWKERLVVGGDVGFDAAANTGITIMGTSTKIKLYNLNARAVIGYDLRRKSGMMVFGRLGYRFESFQVSDAIDLDKNVGKLPSEIVRAPTIGAALSLPRLTQKFGLRFSVDSVLFGASMVQTKRLEDGQNPTAKGALVGTGLTYAWKDTFFITATYDLTFFKKSFGAPVEGSLRQHDGMSAARTDIFHQATVGVARAF